MRVSLPLPEHCLDGFADATDVADVGWGGFLQRKTSRKIFQVQLTVNKPYTALQGSRGTGALWQMGQLKWGNG